jgi:hypothetical protein
MRKAFAAAVLCAVAIIPVAAASGAAKKGPQKVSGKINLTATPTDEVVPPATKVTTTSVTVTGKLKSRATCRRGRRIQFIYVTPAGSYTVTPKGSYDPLTVVTARNGSFSATLPAPTGITSKQNGTAVTISAEAAQTSRKDKKSGRKFRCLTATGISDFTDRT